MPLVQIGDTKATPPKRKRNAPSADLFFSAGIIFAIIGTGILGTLLWLSLRGQIHIPSNYQSLRTTHALLNLYGFLAAFIVGFLLQAGPKIFGVNKPVHQGSLAVFLLYTTGIALLLFDIALGAFLLSAAFFLTMLLVADLLAAATTTTRLTLGIPCLIGLFAFAIGIFLPFERPFVALALLWTALLPITMSVSQQITKNLFDGKSLTSSHSLVLFGAWSIAVFALACFSLDVLKDLMWSSFSLFAMVTLLLYFCFTQTWRALFSKNAYGLGIGISWLWALIATVVSFRGALYVDFIFHLLAIGFASTLILSVSSRVVSAITQFEVFSDRGFYILLFFWQTVPIERGLKPFLPLPHFFTWVAVCCAFGVLIVWATAIFRSLFKFITFKRRQRMHQ